MSGVFYLLACLQCEPPLPMPFGSPAERGKWASEHTRGTGHDRWRVWEEPDRAPAGGSGGRTYIDPDVLAEWERAAREDV